VAARSRLALVIAATPLFEETIAFSIEYCISGQLSTSWLPLATGSVTGVRPQLSVVDAVAPGICRRRLAELIDLTSLNRVVFAGPPNAEEPAAPFSLRLMPAIAGGPDAELRLLIWNPGHCAADWAFLLPTDLNYQPEQWAKVRARMCVCVCVCVCVCASLRLCVYMCVCAYIYIYIYISCVCALVFASVFSVPFPNVCLTRYSPCCPGLAADGDRVPSQTHSREQAVCHRPLVGLARAGPDTRAHNHLSADAGQCRRVACARHHWRSKRASQDCWRDILIGALFAFCSPAAPPCRRARGSP
jgi:hypothetical protein